MSIISFREILENADRGRYAVGAFNVSDVETAEVILQVAFELKSPVILQIWGGVFEKANAQNLVFNLRNLLERSPVPSSLHLDHCGSFADIKKGIDLGFSSVMIDASALPFDENVAMTKEVVDYAHKYDVDVEAELGVVGSGEASAEEIQGEGRLTDPNEAGLFAKQTGIDALAVAIGTAHGLYKSDPKLDLERLMEIKRHVQLPLVLHGGSGTPDQGVRKAIELGINKVNVATELNVAFLETLRDVVKQGPSPHFPAILLHPARLAVAPVIRRKMELFGSANQAELSLR